MFGSGLAAAETRLSDSVIISQVLDDDLYAAAGKVRIDGRVTGAAVVAAGSARFSGDVDGDVIVAAGRVDVEGGVGDDLRAAAGNIQIAGFVTDQATLAGGTVAITRDGAIGGRTWIAGGDVEVDGQVGGDLKVAAGTVVIRGRIVGTVEVAARTIRVEPGAIIRGDLVWRSSQPPEIAGDARIYGAVRAAGEGEAPWPASSSDSASTGRWAFGITILVAALILLWSAPRFVANAAGAFGRRRVERCCWVRLQPLSHPLLACFCLQRCWAGYSVWCLWLVMCLPCCCPDCWAC
ncbi:MAG: polymer-forming cytoskeletal protein [Gammaproteobacteria bacterium]